ncbi:unnamed protein product, partial [Allacma fusca]
MLKAEVQM